jgi:hypothetical protein
MLNISVNSSLGQLRFASTEVLADNLQFRGTAYLPGNSYLSTLTKLVDSYPVTNTSGTGQFDFDSVSSSYWCTKRVISLCAKALAQQM